MNTLVTNVIMFLKLSYTVSISNNSLPSYYIVYMNIHWRDKYYHDWYFNLIFLIAVNISGAVWCLL